MAKGLLQSLKDQHTLVQTSSPLVLLIRVVNIIIISVFLVLLPLPTLP
jgi:hypothetical protein